MSFQLAQHAGYCPGVLSAVDWAEKMLAEREAGEVLVMLGALVHNQMTVDALLERGFLLAETVDDCPAGSSVLIRAHGVPPQSLAALRAKGCRIVDQTCPFVYRIHRLVAREAKEGRQILLVGNPKHPEIVGIAAVLEHQVVHVPDLQSLETAVIPDRPTSLFVQTTYQTEQFKQICQRLGKLIANLRIFDTICHTTVDRQKEAAEIAQTSDLVLVLGSSHSSNTRQLQKICEAYCRETILIQWPDQVSALIEGRDLRQLRIGITAGASTPERMIREVIHVMTENEVFSNEQEVTEGRVDAPVEETTTEEAVEAVEQAPAADTLELEVPGTPADVVEEDVALPSTEASETEVSGTEDAAEASEALAAVETEEEPKEMSFSDYIDGIPQLKRGMVVKGTIVRYDDEFVYIDVRDKSEGKVPRHEFLGDEAFDLEQAAETHQALDVYVRHIKNSDMGKEILLSKAKVDFTKHKDAIEKAFEEKTPVEIKITNVVKDGIIGAYGSVDIYVHRTQLELHIVDDLEAYRGQTLEVLVTQFDPHRKRLRVSASRRSLLARERKARAKIVWENIEVGKEYDGTVRNLTDFGAFVDLGGVDGLVHISELSWKRIRKASEVVSVGDRLSVFVKDFDRERRRISLGYRRPENDPYYNIEERFPMGSIVRGVVVRMFPFGAFVEIAPGVDALCHISQISNYRLNRPEDVLQEGMEVDARVLEVSNEARKISISIKEVEAIDPEIDEGSENPFQAHRSFEERAPRRERRPRRERQPRDDNDGMMTAYTDSSAGGSSLSSMAAITVSSEAGAEVMKSLGLGEDADAEPVVEEAVEVVETVDAEATDAVEAPVEEEKPEALVSEDVTAETEA